MSELADPIREVKRGGQPSDRKTLKHIRKSHCDIDRVVKQPTTGLSWLAAAEYCAATDTAAVENALFHDVKIVVGTVVFREHTLLSDICFQ